MSPDDVQDSQEAERETRQPEEVGQGGPLLRLSAAISRAESLDEVYETVLDVVGEALHDTERLRRLQHVTESLSEAATPVEVAEVVVAEGVAATGAATGGLWLLDAETKIAALVHAEGYTKQERAGFATIDIAGSMSMPAVDVFRHDQPIWLESRDELVARYPQLAKVTAPRTEHRIACLPVRAGGRCVAVLVFTFDVLGGFEQSERDLLVNVARQASLALERSQLLEAERGARVEAEAVQRRLAFKAEASAVLASSLDYASSLATVAKLALPRFADWCVIEIGDSANEAVPIVAEGSPQPEQVALARATGSLSVIRGPITIQGQEIGSLMFGRTDPRRPYEAADVDTAVGLGQRAGFAIENARLRQHLERAVKARNDLLAIVSHDLRTPLGVVTMKTSLIERMLPAEPEWAKLSARVKKQLSGIRSSTERMEDLIDDLQDLGSIEAGQLKIEPQPHDLGTLLGSAVDDVQALAASKSVRLDVQPPAEAVLVRCDPKRIRQVLTNLIGNAIKFTTAGGSIVVGADTQDGLASVLVRDNGPGIDGRDLSRIFERYYQGPAGQRSGVGLGLFIAKAIVEAHGGRIWVDSIPGDGSSFHFTLPLDRGAAIA